MAKEFKLTRERLKELEAELNYLKTTKEKEVAELIKEARSFGDLSENSEYDEAKNDQGKLESRIAEIEEMLKNVRVLDDDDVTNETVSVGSRVKVRDIEYDEIVTYQIVGFTQADPDEGRISDESPVGMALLGHKVGETVEAEVPSGVLSFEILEISR